MIHARASGGVETTKTRTESRTVRPQLSRADRTVFHPASPSLGPSTRITFLSSFMTDRLYFFFRVFFGSGDIRTFDVFFFARAFVSCCAVFCNLLRAL